ncbi:MAG: DUF2334 domain-containing protein [Chthoniobacterales bacterium]
MNKNSLTETTKPLPVVWTNDDIAFGKAVQFRRHLDFVNRHGIPGVFFVIPDDRGAGTLDQDKELVDLMRGAMQEGHEFYQHGYRHHAFECGIPEQDMLYVDPMARKQLDEERESIEAQHTLEAQVEMLVAGQRIWKKVFGEDSPGFRPGWGAYCMNLYRALAILGYEWVSARIPCMTSWLRNAGRWDEPINFRDAVPTRPQRLSQGILEIPMAGDYAFQVPNDPEKIDSMVDLGLQELQVYIERRHPMLILSHYHGLEYSGTTSPDLTPLPGGTGYAVHEKLVPAILSSGEARFVGMRELLISIHKDENES